MLSGWQHVGASALRNGRLGTSRKSPTCSCVDVLATKCDSKFPSPPASSLMEGLRWTSHGLGDLAQPANHCGCTFQLGLVQTVITSLEMPTKGYRSNFIQQLRCNSFVFKYKSVCSPCVKLDAQALKSGLQPCEVVDQGLWCWILLKHFKVWLQVELGQHFTQLVAS